MNSRRNRRRRRRGNRKLKPRRIKPRSSRGLLKKQRRPKRNVLRPRDLLRSKLRTRKDRRSARQRELRARLSRRITN